MNKPLLENCARLLSALEEYGEVKGIGGMVWFPNGEPLMSATSMYHAVRKLLELGISVRRVDSGGLPTWSILA